LRKTHKPVTLSTGHTIPADTLVAALNPLYNASATPHIKDGDRFNPERWLRDNDDENQDAYWKFGSATTDSLIFGYGKHACPGRPFGVTMVKDWRREKKAAEHLHGLHRHAANCTCGKFGDRVKIEIMA
jgi:cytochrome P450